MNRWIECIALKEIQSLVVYMFKITLCNMTQRIWQFNKVLCVVRASDQSIIDRQGILMLF